MSLNPKLCSQDGIFFFVDSDNQILQSRKIIRLLERYRSYFSNIDELKLSSDLSYVELTELIEKLNNKLESDLEIDSEITAFIEQSKYEIEERRIAGITIKDYDARWTKELSAFNNVLDEEITRPLKEQQIQASFFLAMMKRAANFSVPGAGKTAMMYGAFAYLSSPKINEVNKLLVISPLNAFEAWRAEYIEVFQAKRNLHYINLKEYKDAGSIRTAWGTADVIVLNYESLSGWKLAILNELIDEKVMIVFDEVHRIKNPEGKRAQGALTLGNRANYHYVLTGTPIPNSYKDIYNFLHLLYNNEYNRFFGWNVADLDESKSDEINDKLQPFFWRTNKADLKVPPADEDIKFEETPSPEQLDIIDTIYDVETNVLGKYIRLLQASTNPELLTEKIDINSLGLLDDEADFAKDAKGFADFSINKQQAYLDLNVENAVTPKFIKGINLIKQLTSEGKKVIVWGMFVGTMKKIQQQLKLEGISAHLIYGETPKDQRVGMIDEFRDGNVQVLISNPATLGESISLHQTVHDAIYFEYNFNLTFMLQSRDRIHRLGLPDNQYTRYYYLMTKGDKAHKGFIDNLVYDKLKIKEEIMKNAIDGKYLMPEVSDNYLDDIKDILSSK